MRRAAVLVSRVVPIVVTFVFVVLQKKGLEKAGWIAPGRGEVNSIGHNHDERKKLTPQFTLNCLFIARCLTATCQAWSPDRVRNGFTRYPAEIVEGFKNCSEAVPVCDGQISVVFRVV